ncbi:hypothetical protein ASPZODRAFT_137501 [Penicilliopsis zonata CBS 506.65]|uniref:Isochorismatase-like domain-containing protein n=1 Tax=Penicilliopsis zonata CBS 506.65 TaxID=1073090 RepID=A0A1L9S4J2_9EURO|nr:hypothetical protein ASPZODRAFT_137501 [Penicilliopsis zonata CBS 506.65]OJJ42081.1 hypothetical protein ASPZODRAFT_137501 [Penicilliopsis zonata CBS 506.65]
MSRYSISDNPPISRKNTTALLLINNQLGFRDISAWGTGASTPDYDKNISALISLFRDICAKSPEGEGPLMIHVQYRPVWTDHPLHVSKTGPFGANGEEQRAIDFLEFAAPQVFRDGAKTLIYSLDETASSRPAPTQPPDEIIMTCHGHSVFINTPLETILKNRGIKTLLIAGMGTDLAVSTAVRTAQNLALTGKWGGRGNMEDVAASERWTDGAGVYAGEEDKLVVDMPRIILIQDATRAFGKGGVDAQTVHHVHIESLRGFSEVRDTAGVIEAMTGGFEYANIDLLH